MKGTLPYLATSFRDGRRTRSASRRARGSGTPPRRASRTVRKATRSGRARARPHRSPRESSTVPRPSPRPAPRTPSSGLPASASAVRSSSQDDDHAPAPPHLGHVREIEIVPVVLGVPQRRRLGVGARACLPDVRRGGGCSAPRRTPPSARTRSRCAPSSRSGRRRAGRSGGTPLRRPGSLRAPRRARDRSDSRRQRREDRIEALDRLGLAADHQAVAALEPHTPPTSRSRRSGCRARRALARAAISSR